MDDLKKLPLTTIIVSGKPQEGPALADVLKAANIQDYTQVTVIGTGQVVLQKDEVTPQVVLDFNNRGTVKLASPALPIPSPVQDITTIKVE